MFNNVELHKLYTVTIPSGINDTGIALLSQQFYTYIEASIIPAKRTEKYTDFAKFTYANPQDFLPANWDWQYSIGGRGKYIGNMARRMSKLAQTEYDVKLSAESLAVLGQIARDNSNTEEVVHIDFTDSLTWSAGDFGDSGSCYWGCHNSARAILMEHKALGLRLWRSPEVYGDPAWKYAYGYDKDGNHKLPGIGRAWLIPPTSHEFGDHVIIYNGYGGTTKPNGDHTNLSTLWFARVLAAFLGTDYKKIKLNNNGSWDGELYINNGNAYAVGNWLNLADITHIDLNWAAADSYTGDDGDFYTCDNCGWSTENEDAMYYPENTGTPLCEDCYGEMYTHCYNCEGEIHTRDSYNGSDDNNYCWECYTELFFECARCGNNYNRDKSFCVNDDDLYCERCIERRNIKQCAECEGYYTHTMVIVHHESDNIYCLENSCQNCLGDSFEQCQMPECINYFDTDYAEEDDVYCEYCRIKINEE